MFSRSVVTYRRLGLALHIGSLPALRTALPLPRTNNPEIFAAGATSLQVGLADGFLGFTRQCVSDRGGFPSAKIKTPTMTIAGAEKLGRAVLLVCRPLCKFVSQHRRMQGESAKIILQ